MCEDLTQVLPDQLLKLLGGDVTGWTLLLQGALRLSELTGANIVPVPLLYVLSTGLRARYAAQLTGAAAYQCSKKVFMRLVVAPREGLVFGVLLFYEIELLLPYHRRHLCHGDPLLWRQRDGRAVRMSYWVGGRAPYFGGTVACAASVDLSDIGGVGQYPVQ